jgi:hypothetical protein
MSGVNQLFMFSIAQIEVCFLSDIGNPEVIIAGTGFFVRTREGMPIFLTNRHNVDPTLKLCKDYALGSAKVRLRRRLSDQFTSETRFFAIDLHATRLLSAPSADIAAFVSPNFSEKPDDFSFYSINLWNNFADQGFFENKAELMDWVSFLGYPGTRRSKWWDTEWNTPIARHGSLASVPSIAFSNSDIRTADVSLVSGLSFAGSSGSVVLLHEKGIPPGDILDPRYVPPTILGIMSGHWWEPSDEPDMFRHSGLSYFTRSTSILALLSGIA